MEIAGLGISILSLCSLFETAVNCFEYVEVAKDFAQDHQTTCLRLDTIQLRLSRWGAAVGMPTATTDRANDLAATYPAEEVNMAERLLKQIVALFERAQKSSLAYTPERRADSDTTSDNASTWSSDGLALHRKLKQIVRQRVTDTSLVRRIKWTTTGKDLLKRLMDDLDDLVQKLTELFPAVAQQEHLCEEEAQQLVEVPTRVPLIQDLMSNLDPGLARFIQQYNAIELSRGNNTSAIYHNQSAKIMNQATNQTFNGGQNFAL